MRKLFAAKEKERAAWMRSGSRIPQRKSLTSMMHSTGLPGVVSAGASHLEKGSAFWLRTCAS